VAQYEAISEEKVSSVFQRAGIHLVSTILAPNIALIRVEKKLKNDTIKRRDKADQKSNS
jgi:hypothetical protein